MNRTSRISIALMIASISLVPAWAEEPTPELITVTGQAKLLGESLKPRGITGDSDSTSKLVVLEVKPGNLESLLPDIASRALLLDERLRNRPIEIKGRRYPGLPFLQVMNFRVEEEGRWRTPEYYCDVCTIQVRYPQICPCCQGPMVLRMKPEAP